MLENANEVNPLLAALNEKMPQMTFEEIVGELESVVAAMDSREIGIEAATDLYEQASLLHKGATKRLQEVTLRVQTLKEAKS